VRTFYGRISKALEADMRLKCSVASVALVLFALPVLAHHSHDNYRDSMSDLTGVVKEVHLVAPHSWVYVEAKDANGTPKVWALEGSSRSGLEKIGITRDYLKVGDTIKVRSRCTCIDRSTPTAARYPSIRIRRGTATRSDGGRATRSSWRPPAFATAPGSRPASRIALTPGAELWEDICVPSDYRNFNEHIYTPVSAGEKR
jgi:hypothetical protein